MRTAKFVVASGIVTLASACTVPPESTWIDCDPDPRYPEKGWCDDAGADAGANAADDAQAGANDPDASTKANRCTEGGGRCVPVPSKDNAGYWSEIPISLWVSAPGSLPKECPNGVSNEKFRLFAELDAPPAACEPCTCGPSEGTCTKLPETIEIRAGECGESDAAALPFDGPAGWDGACTSENALPADAQCGGEPCAQSVWASPLPGPTSETPCSPTKEMPAFTTKTEWKLAGLACMGNTDDDACGTGITDTETEKKYCVREPGPGWLSCVYTDGVQKECPANYNFARYEMHPEVAIDDRGCDACACGSIEASRCDASLRLYNDATCSSEFEKLALASPYDKCVDIVPPGRAIGAKAITDLAYVQGTCASAGGAPKGGAFPDPTSAVTFCCLGPFYVTE